MLLPAHDLIWIGLGSNIGDCRQNLNDAISRIGKDLATVIQSSSVYRSEPVEVTEQPWFFNQVIGLELDPTIGPTQLLKHLKTLERELGRTPGLRYGPRIIDLDILFYRNWVYESACLMVPHPKLEKRSFVLQPLIEVAPELIHPRSGKTIGELFKANHALLSYCEKLDLPN